MKNNLDKQYLDLLRDIKENGVKKEGRNGTTYSVFGRQIRHDMREGFPLLTTKKMWFKGIRTELQWFLNGDTNIKYLVERGNNIWVGDAFKIYYEQSHEFRGDWPDTEEEFIERIKTDDEFAEKWGNMGKIYGWQWRNWNDEDIDQIQNLIDDLNNKPDSRRIIVNAWNVAKIDDMVLPPCHYSFQVWTRELTLEERCNIYKEKNGKTIEDFDAEWETNTSIEEDLNFNNIPERGITLMWQQRSCDVPLGIPFNIASYGLLLEMIADEVNMLPLELIGSLGDTHIYKNQMEGVEKQLQRDLHPLPEVQIMDGIFSRGKHDIRLKNYQSEDKIKFPLSN